MISQSSLYLAPASFSASQQKSSHWGRIQRYGVLALICFVLITLYLTTDCWPAVESLFDYRRNLLEEFSQHSEHNSDRTCFSKRHRMPSLLARPLKHVTESPSVQSLNVKRLEMLFKIANNTDHLASISNCTEQPLWKLHHRDTYKNRRSRVHRICSRYGFDNRVFTTWHRSSNRRHVILESSSHHKSPAKYCSTRYCPLVVNEQHRLLTCFVQKVASTSIKQLYLYLDSNQSSTTRPDPVGTVDNLTTFHVQANNELYRISPMYLKNSKEANYYKTLFVRHPFVRLVSAFKDKAERSPQQEPYFYSQYWNPLLKRIYGEQNVNESSRVTFEQFVEELLLPTDPYQFDEHWAPIWTRCEPCYIHYDFVGKLETSELDFKQFQKHINENLVNLTIWQNGNRQFGTTMNFGNSIISDQKQCHQQRFKYDETIRYLSQLKMQTIVELYKRYYLDFEMFGYSVDELFALE